MQAAFLQSAVTGNFKSVGAVSQQINLSNGIYTISLEAAQRSGQLQPIAVSVDGSQIGVITPGSNNFGNYTTPQFNVGTGTHIIKFAASDSSGDKTSLIDAASINSIDLAPIFTNAPSGAILSGGTSAQLSVLGQDQAGENNLTYRWSVVGTPPQPVTFSPNGTNAAKNAVATFTAPGSYTLQVTAMDSLGLSTTATVVVTIQTIALSSGNQNLRLASSGGSLFAYFNNGSSPAYSVSIAELSSLDIVMSGGSNAVNIDFSAGASPVPSGGISVPGSGTDALLVTGTTSNDSAVVTATAVAFDGSVINYSNLGSISIRGNGGSDTLTQNAQPANNAVLAFAPSATNLLYINAGTFAIPPSTGGVVPVAYSTLSIASGASVLVAKASAPANRQVLVLSSLSIAGTGKLDLSNNDMLLHFGNLAIVNSLLSNGYNGGNWTGSGIDSSAAAADATQLSSLGGILNNLGNGQTLFGGANQPAFDGLHAAATDVLVKYTYYGDADLNGVVDSADYARIDNGLLSQTTASPLTGWQNGDFNYDGVINGSDYKRSTTLSTCRVPAWPARLPFPAKRSPTPAHVQLLYQCRRNQKLRMVRRSSRWDINGQDMEISNRFCCATLCVA